ncbi:NEDD4-binding protein 2-like 2 [Phyllopteryx taeniolatus]|uniref:NEDD4-binding protein 2-like 2 n=1 Tax=Phyllopteryx taeniolatus TaxID=161469 RepID=UPI002AD4A96E|nr:NEDD4-binding protein 2-like 2 [Phyllopteryx taeniolatus]
MSQAAPSCGQNSSDAPVDSEESEAVVKEATDVQRVLKEVGLTSTAFIGPTCPPEKNIDDSLSEFYKELQAIDGQAEREQDAFVQPETTSTSKPPEKDEDTIKPLEKLPKDERRRPEKHHFWPHWYKNHPYSTPRPDNSTSWNHLPYYPPPTFHPPPDRRSFHGFRQPSFLNPPRFPPPRHGHPTSDQHYPPRFPPFPGFSAAPHHNHHNRIDDYGEGGGYDAGWPQDPPPCHFDEDEARRQHCHGLFDESSSLVLILMRGLPGSGKTTMARELLLSGPSGLILSTDDYFAHNGGYRYEPGLLGEAHEWNHRRASDAMHDGHSPVIIDNTNLQAWEMKPYVQMALQRGYRVDFCEPNTSWKYDPWELEKRNKHGVPQEKIAQMLDRFSYPISVDVVLSSREPQHVQQGRQTELRKDTASFRY